MMGTNLERNEKNISAALRKFESGIGLDDPDLGLLQEFFGDLVRKLELLSPDFNLALMAARRALAVLNEFEEARRQR